MADVSGSLGIEDISHPQNQARFVPVKSDALSINFTTDVIWMKFAIANLSEDSRAGYLYFPIPWIEELDVYVDGASQPLQLGMNSLR